MKRDGYIVVSVNVRGVYKLKFVHSPVTSDCILHCRICI